MRYVLLACLCFLSFNAYADNEWNGVNPNSPLSIGDVIYRNKKSAYENRNKVWFHVAYFYRGSTDNTVMISEEPSSFDMDGRVYNSPVTDYTLPINKNGQAVLKVRTLQDDVASDEVLITRVDDFARIRVEPYRPGK